VTLMLLVLGVAAPCCAEPKRANGEPCLINDQCETDYCRAGMCAVMPTRGTNYDGSVSAADASDRDDAASGADAARDGDLDSPAEAADDAGEDAIADRGGTH
jgi:hypothetical protein